MNYYEFFIKKTKFNEKYKNFSDCLNLENFLLKNILIISSFVLVSITFTMFNLIKQRISVPELFKFKPMSYYFTICGCLFVIFNFIMLIFNNELKMFFNSKLLLSDNFTYFGIAVFGYLFSYFSYVLLTNIKIMNSNHVEKTIIMKKKLITYQLACISICKFY